MNTAYPVTNPLLDFTDLPRYADVKPEHISPAIQFLIQEAEKTLAEVVNNPEPASWENTEWPLLAITEKLGRAWGVVSHLNMVVSTPELREAHNLNQEAVSIFYTAMGQNEALYARYKAIAANPDFAKLSPQRQTVIQNSLRDFKLSGAELTGQDKVRHAEIATRLSVLASTFSEHVQDATDAWEKYVTLEALAGVPAESVAQFLAQAVQAGKTDGLYRLTLQMPCYLAIMQYADNRELREEMYQAYAQRASEFDAPERDNTPVIQEKLALAREEALLLGFQSYADLSIATKMADSPEEVIDFLRGLASHAKPAAFNDKAQLSAFAADKLPKDSPLAAWDLAYFAEKLRESEYAYSEQEVKQYFPLPRVLTGLFQLINDLYDVTLQAEPKVRGWHEDVVYYTLHKNGQLIGGVYLDLYARAGKQPGAWMNDVRGRQRLPDGTVQLPVALLVCNFNSPLKTEASTLPSTLNHDDIITLFHEFGHGLHHLLTQIDEIGVSGINGVVWDAVELPSQFMENFCWEWPIISQMSAHVETQAPLPKALFDKMLTAKNFQSGMQMVRQIELSLFDLLLYHTHQPSENWLPLLDTIRQEVAVNFPPAYNRFANSFSHIFGGGYAAGYYSYKWAEVLSADVYAAFEEAALSTKIDTQTETSVHRAMGEHFLKTLLSQGGSRKAMDLFIDFRGRKPDNTALLKHSGLLVKV